MSQQKMKPPCGTVYFLSLV